MRLGSVEGIAGVSLLCALVACGGGGGGGVDAGLGGPREPFPDQVCPGSDGCTGQGDGVFKVGAAQVEITPNLDDYETEYTDDNGDGEWESGEAFVDKNGNNIFDAVWLAGFGNGRPATSVHAPIWVRSIVFEWNDIRLAIVTVDCVGWMANAADATREMLPASLGIDHLIMQATHVHEAPDTLGLWGRKELESGLDPDYMQSIREKSVQAVSDAVDALEPVTMSYAVTQTLDPGGSARPYVGDGRDPNILDPTLTVVQFKSVAQPDQSVATLIHWSAHPEYSGSSNDAITPDYIYMLRDGVENGLPAEPDRTLPAVDGVGGEVLFLQGTLGGQIGPHGTRPIAADGTEITQEGLDRADAVGRNVARLALDAITSTDKVVDVDSPSLEFRTGAIDLAVENTFYHVASIVGVFDRQFHGNDPNLPLGPSNIPYIDSRVTYFRVGTLGVITAPGELHPELFIGGYDGSFTYDSPIIDPNNPNPPMLDNAPQPPYLRQLITDLPGVDHAICMGLAEDMIGYIVPSYNYQLDDNTPYVEEAPGDHYEETNSVGPLVEEQAVGSMRTLIEWQPSSN